MRHSRSLLCIDRAVGFVLVLVSSLALFAQEGTIVGTVKDQSGGLLGHVAIRVQNTDTAIERNSETNSVGQYVVSGLTVGTYDLQAASPEFQEQRVQKIVINENDRVRVDFQMKIGVKTEPVIVEATPIEVQADSGEQSSLISGTQISELSTNGRSIYSYIALAPGATNLMPSFQPPTSIAANSNVSFNGNRQGHNLYLLDGGENDDRGGAGSSIIMPSIDAIAETQTLTSNYSAEYGLSSAGTINSVLKSGTKPLHFSLWEFFRNDALDARNYFNAAPSPVAELRYNLFGFNLGGPVAFGKLYNPNKNKPFFFYNMEWRRLIQGLTLNQPFPSTDFYQGNFSTSGYSVAQLHAPASCQVSSAIAAQFAGANQALSGCTNGAPDPNLQVPFNNDSIANSLLDQNAQALLNAGGKYGGIFPAPNVGRNFVGGNNVPTNVREEIVRIDQNISDKFVIYGHLVAEQISQAFGTAPYSLDNSPSSGASFANPAYAAVVHTVNILQPTLVNEAAFNYNGNRVGILPVGLVSAPSDFTFHRSFDGPNTDNRIPSILMFGSTGSLYSSGILPWRNSADSYQIRDDISWTRGRHQFRGGASWMLYKKAQNWFQSTQGNFVFTGLFTGNDFADYLLGYATNYFESAVQSTGHWNSVSVGTYFQDNWRATGRLTLNLGLRWDGIPHTYEANSQMSNFYPNSYSRANAAQLSSDYQTILPSSPGLGTGTNPILAGTPLYVNGLGVCGKQGLPAGCVNDAWLNFGPRLGFAYSVTSSGKTVIRGGFGIMYERIQGNDVYNMAGNAPFSAGVNFFDASLSNPNTSVLTGVTIPTSIPVSSVVGLEQTSYAAPRSSQFSLGIQQAVRNMVLSIAYVGTQNRHQSFYSQTNLPPQSLLPAFLTNPALAQTYNATVPYVGYNSVQIAQNEGNAEYNSLQVTFRGTALHNDLTIQAGYTYARTNDFFDGASASQGDLGNVSNPYDGWKYDFGPSCFDIRNNFFGNFVYRIPFFRTSGSWLLRTTLGGWEVSGIISAISGAPLNIGLAGQSVTSLIPDTLNRPDRNGVMKDPHTVQKWFDTTVFSSPAPGAWGNEPHNGVRGPGRDNWNLSLIENFPFNEDRGSNLQFRAEFFNAWNHPQWIGDALNGGINTYYGASNFGTVTAAYDPRTIQLALKLSY